ncbi:MAG: hypothetical protein PHT95_07200, partial [Candidatus Omnitrophica bacterium]|nr:hypothetical protein [Candidatus Omnitrophota bacterium]
GSYYESLGVPVENSVPIWANPIDLIEVNTSSIGSFTLICTDPDEDFVYYSLQNNLSGMLSINGSELQWLKWDESNKSTHLISINCSDTFSNVSKEFTYNISDTTLPLYSNAVNTSTEINRFENVTFNVTFSDYFPNKVYFMYAEGVEDYSSIIFDWVNQTQTFSVTRNVTTIPGLNNTYYWIGFDESYNENTTSIIDFSVINRNPILIENIPDKIVNMTQEYEINLSNYFTDYDLEPLTYSVDSKSSNNLSVSINGDIATVSALTLEFEWVIFRATDNSEGFVNSNVVDILVMNNPPVWVNPTDIINANSSSASSFTLLCDDPEFEVVSFDVNTTLGNMLSINGNELEWLKWNESNKSTHTILVNCSDFFSNVSKEFTYNISDTTSPTYSNIENTSSEIYRFENITFTGTFNDYFPIKVYFMYDEGTGSFSEIEFDWTEQEETFSVTRNVTTVPGELNRYYWRAVDESGNEINTSTTEFSVLNKAPILYLEIPDKIVNMTQEYEINLSNYFTDLDLEPLTYSVNSKSSNNLSVSINGEIATVSALTLEFEWVIFRATDNSEGFVNSNTMEIYVFNQPPVWVNPTDIINVNSSSVGSFTLLCTDPESKPLSFTINDTLNEMLSINGNELEWLKWDESNKSTHTILVNCSDFFSNVTEIFTYNILDTTSPTYSNIENTSSAIYRFENVTFTGTFNDYFPSKVYFMYDEGTGSFSEIEFDWIEQEETFSVTRNVTTVPGELNRYYWRAVDESDNVNVTSTIEFNVINSEPVFTGTIPSFTINENENREIILSNYFTDADLETLTYSVDSKSSSDLITTISGNKVTIRSSVPGFEWVILRATDSASSYVNSNKIDVSILRIPQAPIISNVEVNGISSVSDSGTQALGLLSLSDNQMRIFSDLPEVTDLDVVTITGEVISEDVSSLSCTTSSDESTLDDLPVNLIVGTPNTFSFTTYLIPSGIHDVDIICQDDFGITSLLSSIKVSLYPTDLLINPETIEVIPNNPNVGQQVAGFFSINNSGIRDATDVRVDLYVNNVNKGYI